MVFVEAERMKERLGLDRPVFREFEFEHCADQRSAQERGNRFGREAARGGFGGGETIFRNPESG